MTSVPKDNATNSYGDKHHFVQDADDWWLQVLIAFTPAKEPSSEFGGSQRI